MQIITKARMVKFFGRFVCILYHFPNTDAISCSLVHPCPPGYYCSIVLGETGVCHEEDESINEVFSGSGEKEHMEDDVKTEVDNSKMSKYYGKKEKYLDERDEEAYMEKEEDGDSYVLPDRRRRFSLRFLPRGSKS